MRKIIKEVQSKKRRQLLKLLKRSRYGGSSIQAFLIKKTTMFNINLRRRQPKSVLLRKHWMIIFCKLEMEKDMDLTSIEEKMKRLENSEDL